MINNYWFNVYVYINIKYVYLDFSTNGTDILTPKDVACRKNKSLQRVLYKIPDGMDFKERSDINKSDMLTVVVEISVCNHIKVILINYSY